MNPVPALSERHQPWVQLKYYTFHPSVFPRFLGDNSGSIRSGSTVHVYDRNGDYFGTGFLNHGARVPLRMFHHGSQPPPDEFLTTRLREAIALRKDFLRLDETTEAYRVIHSDGDGLPGLVVDRYADVLSIEVTTLGIWKLLPTWIPEMHNQLGTRRARISVDPDIARMEGIIVRGDEGDPVASVKFQENGIRYEADFRTGHKTGFFCDQRENRKRLGEWTQGRRVLDICSYTGGFALAAKLAGGSPEVTAVDLDEGGNLANHHPRPAEVRARPREPRGRHEEIQRPQRDRPDPRRTRRVVRHLLVFRPGQRRGLRGHRHQGRPPRRSPPEVPRPHRCRPRPSGLIQLPGKPLPQGALGRGGLNGRKGGGCAGASDILTSEEMG